MQFVSKSVAYARFTERTPLGYSIFVLLLPVSLSAVLLRGKLSGELSRTWASHVGIIAD